MDQLLEADWTWTGRSFEPGIRISIDRRGMISSVVASAEAETRGGAPAGRLRATALLPGMVSAHSHAFQRALRGRGQLFPAGKGSFWSWREAMYALVEELDEGAFRRWTRATFDELRAAGVTSVGEFHYFHHAGRDGADYRLDQAVLEEAQASGIRLVLIQTFYRTGGVGRPLEAAQRRFATASVGELCSRREALASACDPATQSTGLAAHSLRAARPEEAGELYAEARRLGLPFHIHLEEQEAEIEEVRSAYGAGPLELLVERLDGAEGLTAIHCTHSTTADLESLARAGGRVCLCPTTEADLGDGLPELAAILDRGPLPALGTDSNLRVSLSEEMRWLEWGQRLLSRRRGVVTDAGGDSARRLFELATSGGARSLGLEVGAIRAGVPADLVQLDLDHPSLAGCGPDELLASFVFGGADEAIVATSVGGHWREHRRRRG